MGFRRNWHLFPINVDINIEFYGDNIRAMVTSEASFVDQWIENIYRTVGDKFVVGLDTEWKKNEFEAVVLQLCVGRHCLIYQMSQSKTTPQSLIKFLGDENLTFVGKAVGGDVALLARRGLHVKCAMDVADMAAKKYAKNKYEEKEYKSKGLKALAMEFLDKEMEKNKKITTSIWDNELLTYGQVRYACVDAFVSFELGIQLQTPYTREERTKCIAKTKKFCDNAFSSKESKRKKNRIASRVELPADIGDFSKIVQTGWF